MVVARARDGTRSPILGAVKPARSGIMIELGENASDENSAQVSNAENSDNCDCFMFVLGEDKLGKNITLCGAFGSRKVLP